LRWYAPQGDGPALVVVAVDLAEGAGQGAQMAQEDFAEHGVEVDDVAAQRLRVQVQGKCEPGEQDQLAAVTRHEGLARREDVLVACQLFWAAAEQCGGDVPCFGAEDAGNPVLLWRSFSRFDGRC